MEKKLIFRDSKLASFSYNHNNDDLTEKEKLQQVKKSQWETYEKLGVFLSKIDKEKSAFSFKNIRNIQDSSFNILVEVYESKQNKTENKEFLFKDSDILMIRCCDGSFQIDEKEYEKKLKYIKGFIYGRTISMVLEECNFSGNLIFEELNEVDSNNHKIIVNVYETKA